MVHIEITETMIGSACGVYYKMRRLIKAHACGSEADIPLSGSKRGADPALGAELNAFELLFSWESATYK
jgi:hypothetical protein